jgi:ribonuclease T2
VKQPNPNLKTIGVVAAIIGTLLAMYLKRPPASAPARASGSIESGPIVEETRDRGNSVPSGGGGRSEVSREVATRRADFDFYLLAMSVHRAFCADHAGKPECRVPTPRPLVIHGLWPENREPRAYPRDCPAPPLDLEPALARELADFMPGMRSGLHEHEWRTHGACSGLGDDGYFRRTLELARHLDAALAPTLTTRAGGPATSDDLRTAADRLEPGLGATLTFHCRMPRDAPQAQRGRPYLLEVRQCLDDDGANGGPGTPLACARVNRRDQGCGQSFHIAEAR